MSLCAATLLVMLVSPLVAVAQSWQENLEYPTPARYSAMGNAGIAVADPAYGMLNPASVAAWALDGGTVALNRLSLDGHHGYDRQTEAVGARLGDLKCGSTLAAFGFSHTRHQYVWWYESVFGPEDHLFREEVQNDDFTIGVAVRNGVEVGLGFRINHLSERTSDWSSDGSQYSDTDYHTGALLRLHLSEIVDDLTSGQNVLSFGAISFDGETALARVTGEGDDVTGYSAAIFTYAGEFSLLSARWARDNEDHSHSSGWELNALGVTSYRGGRHGLWSEASPPDYTTHGWSVHLGGVFDWIAKRHEDAETLHWLLTHADASYERSWNFRSDWTSWSFSLGTAPSF